ncbi:glycosyltransferase family 2 protein [Croceicoccus marinus]|uniref:Glycosyltransferase family 2 protein n=1 Tax=Croceicoccus marinus TaxID=450378 RepID=A0A7G6VT11_9SPHN|nr:glycosyltransferase family 2 protein [Croceicoccus marinus]
MGNRVVTVVISAFNAALTISRAVSSALASPEVRSVILIDDASDDGTGNVAQIAAEGSPRLRITRNEVNRGPAAGRNRGFEMADTEVVAILDADDQVASGRFTHLLNCDDWDLIADNIRFSRTLECDAGDAAPVRRTRTIDLSEFASRNISRPGQPRGELGFLKPIIKTDFIRAHRLAYDETLRLGEDFIFYANALACGARFRLADTVGYIALEREDSLSGKHRTDELIALAEAGWELIATLPPGPERRAMQRYNRAVEIKARHRRLLDERRQLGAAAAMINLLATPRYVPGVLTGILRDKLADRPASPQPPPNPRLLLDSSDFLEDATIQNGNRLSG